MRVLASILLSILLAGCATEMSARSDFDTSQDFTRYQTFAWIGDQPLIVPPGQATRVSALNQRRIVEAIESGFAKKGFRMAPTRESADFVVSYTVGARDRIDVHAYPQPYQGVWHRGWPYIGREVDVRAYREGTLAIDVFDNRTHRAVWHGWTTRRLTEHDVEHAAELIPQAVDTILAQFPPRP